MIIGNVKNDTKPLIIPIIDNYADKLVWYMQNYLDIINIKEQNTHQKQTIKLKSV